MNADEAIYQWRFIANDKCGSFKIPCNYQVNNVYIQFTMDLFIRIVICCGYNNLSLVASTPYNRCKAFRCIRPRKKCTAKPKWIRLKIFQNLLNSIAKHDANTVVGYDG